jgi:hypothetical protein
MISIMNQATRPVSEIRNVSSLDHGSNKRDERSAPSMEKTSSVANRPKGASMAKVMGHMMALRVTNHLRVATHTNTQLN